MKATQMKSMVTKVMTAGLLAGAFLFAGAKKAEAQQFSIGVQIGQPVVYPDYYAPRGYYDRDYYERLRCERERREAYERQLAWERQQAWMRHEQHERWEHERHDGWGDRGWDRR